MPKSSTFLFIIIIFFLLFSFASYQLLYKNISDNHKKNQEIVFYQIQKDTSSFLSKLLFKFSKENSDLRLENKKIKDKLAQFEIDSEKSISQQRVNYETRIGELEDKINELTEKIDSIQTDEILLQKLEYWKEKAKQETIKIENLEKQIIAHGDKNFMGKIFG